jgi:serine/threonine-protein kinase RsbW
MTVRTIALRFPAEAQYLILARLALAGLAQAARLDPETLADLKLAVTEACANAVRHAYAPSAEGHVTVVYELDAGAIRVTVDDDGVGFVPPPIETGAPFERDGLAHADHGMGLSIIRAIADDMRITSGPNGRGTSLQLLKKLPGQSPASAASREG